MQLAWLNKGDTALVSTDSEIATAPAANVQSVHLTHAWYTAASVTAAYLIFDMGSAIACDVVALLGTNLTAAGTIRVRAANSEAALTSGPLLDTTVLACGAKTGYGQVYKAFASTTARYWRIDLADAAASGGRLIVGRVFLGPSWTPAVGEELGDALIVDDISMVEESYGRQDWADERPQRRVREFTLGFQTRAEMLGNALAMARANGVVRDVLVVPDFASSYLPEEAIFGPLASLGPIVNYELNLFRQQYRVRERL